MSDERHPADRNLALELMRVTEAGALAAARVIGRGDPNLADRFAVDAVRRTLAVLPIDGVVVVGEGEGRGKERMYLGERLGVAAEPRMDIAVDPVDGADLVAAGAPGAVSTVALAPRNTLFRTHVPYMERIVVGAAAAGAIDITAPVDDNLRAIAARLNKTLNQLTVVMLERPRHEALLRQVRDAGAIDKLIPDGDVSAAVLAALPEENAADVLIGIGGAPGARPTPRPPPRPGGGMPSPPWGAPPPRRAPARRRRPPT